ncbi:MAG: histidine kinase, partial [Thermoanaerobaculia bacterium]
MTNPVGRRLLVSLSISLAVGFLLSHGWSEGRGSVLVRAIAVGLVATLVFGIFERRPRRLPSWIARWALQVTAVAIAIPLSTLTLWTLSTKPGQPQFWEVEKRLTGFMMLTFFGMLVAPWTALAALVRQKEALARHQALAFELERSELERQALDARLHLLQAQAAPHFLFNTLANVQALVDAGSPRASAVLRSLIAYLRAAVPQLDDPAPTLG